MNILHLSDIHFGRNNPEYGLPGPFAKHDQILNELIDKIAGFEEVLRPNHILFTGDIAWMGKESEFHEAIIWFKKLLKACHLTGKDISFCVGNHDIDLSVNYLQEELTKDNIQEMDDLYRYENIVKMEPYLYNYNKFCEQIGMEPYIYPVHGKKHYSYSIGYKDIKFQNGKYIRLVSMNTALMMTQKQIPEDQMWMGQNQILSLIRYGILPADQKIWYTIALFHHPDRFLHPSEINTYNGRIATLPILLRTANLLVCGHSESCGKPRTNKQLGGGIILSGGAAYYNDTHINAFSMIYISSEKKSMAYIPYVYENGWKDYDFEEQELTSESKKYVLPDSIEYQDVIVRCQAKKEIFEIPCKYLEINYFTKNGNAYMHIDNAKDVMNYYRLDCDFDMNISSELPISPNPEQNWNTNYRAAYQKYLHFVQKNSGGSCLILQKNGQSIVRFPGYRAASDTTLSKS